MEAARLQDGAVHMYVWCWVGAVGLSPPQPCAWDAGEGTCGVGVSIPGEPSAGSKVHVPYFHAAPYAGAPWSQPRVFTRLRRCECL